MKNITSLEEDDLRMQYWLTEQDDLVLKVKSKYCMDDYESKNVFY